MFKKDGTPIRKPAAFVAGIEKRGYDSPVFTADGTEIDDPVAFLALMDREEVNAGGQKRKNDGDGDVESSKRHKGAGPGIFKEDGTQVQDPATYIAGMQKRGGNAKLFGADKMEIRDPVAYVAAMQRRGQVSGAPAHSQQGGAYSTVPSIPYGACPSMVVARSAVVPRRSPIVPQMSGKASGKGQWVQVGGKGPGIFKADGTPIRNPEAFVAGIAKSGYHEPILGADGGVIRDPVAYVGAMAKRGEGGGGATRVPMGKAGGKGQWQASSQGQGIFKADGTPIRNPAAFVAGIEKGGYKEPIFGADGGPIRDPVAYVAAMSKRQEGPDSSRSGNSHAGLFKSDGTAIRNPKAFVAGIEKKGYTEMLFDAKGGEIQDPVAYVKAMK